MKLLLVSDAVLWDSEYKVPYDGIVEALRTVVDEKNIVALVSGHEKPNWLATHFPFVKHCACKPKHRMNGDVIRSLLEVNKEAGLRLSDIVILGAKDADFFMAVNSQALLVRCEWHTNLEDKIKKYGLPLSTCSKLPELVALLKDDAPWYFQHTSNQMDVYALANAGTLGNVAEAVINLNAKLKACLKHGAPHLRDEFTAHLLSSLQKTEAFHKVDIWGWYPSSQADNEDGEMMKHFCTLAREMAGKRTLGPLFVRHVDTKKRSEHRDSALRTNPHTELSSIHLNPKYAERIVGATVAVFDDFLTYGLSFGVASALLRKAGAAKVLCVAMGKLGRVAETYNISIKSDNIFQPFTDYEANGNCRMLGAENSTAQAQFLEKFRALL